MTPVNILIVEDHKLIAEAWKTIINSNKGYNVIEQAATEEEAVNAAVSLKPNVVLMDINLKKGDGFSATTRILNKLPRTKIIGLSVHDDLALVKKIMSLGAIGYVTKNSSKEELLTSIKKAVNGEKYICHEIKDKYFDSMLSDEDKPKELTEREIDIVKLIATGLTSKQIGEKLKVSNRTIDTHRHNILKKLQLPNSAQLSIWAKNKGYI